MRPGFPEAAHPKTANTEAAKLDATFAALADATRRAILARLATGDASVMELAAPFSISQPAVSKHLKVLERAGLVTRSRDAQKRPCKLDVRPLEEAVDWLERYREIWVANFQRLDALLEELKAPLAEPAANQKTTKRHKSVGGDISCTPSRRSSGSTAISRRSSRSTRRSSKTRASTRSRR